VKIKKCTLLLFLCLFGVNIWGQVEADDKTTTVKRNTIGLHVSRSNGNFVGYGLSGIALGFGIDYSRKLSKQWSVCTGFNRFVANVKEDYDFIFVTMPVQLKRHFNIFFINFGPHLEAVQFRYKELDEKYLMKWGGGFKFGIGLEPEFKNGIFLSLNPYISLGNSNPQIGVSLGMGYKF